MGKPSNIELAERAALLGFDVVGITPADLNKTIGENLENFVDANWHGDMGWMLDTLDRRKTPTAMWAQAKTAIVLAANYNPEHDPLERLKEKSTGVISVYALNRDYHDVIKGRLKQLAGWFASQSEQEVKVFVDTAPLMEKPLAHKAGIGWQGKHTNLVSREFGSWLFLGVILTTADLEQSELDNGECGTCQACLEICPTNAIPAPYKVDARRCISYLTIEYDGIIGDEFRKSIGNRIYGCDDCLAVCPWNKFAKPLREQKFKAREELVSPKLSYLATLDDSGFRKLFSGSPVKRIGRDRFVRNVTIAIGNSKDLSLKKTTINLLSDNSMQVRAMAVWATKQLCDEKEFYHLKDSHIKAEKENEVISEWNSL